MDIEAAAREAAYYPVVMMIVYGTFCIIGGVIGHVKAKSTISLIAGVVSGLVLFVCAWLFWQFNFAGAVGGLAVAGLLGGRFFMTWRKTKRVMPDLLMVLLSAATIVVVGRLFIQ